jgi:hypothetical protein
MRRGDDGGLSGAYSKKGAAHASRRLAAAKLAACYDTVLVVHDSIHAVMVTPRSRCLYAGLVAADFLWRGFE